MKSSHTIKSTQKKYNRSGLKMRQSFYKEKKETLNTDLHPIHLKVAKEKGKLWYFIE
jgi:transposase